MITLRAQLIRLASTNMDIRPMLLPLLAKTAALDANKHRIRKQSLSVQALINLIEGDHIQIKHVALGNIAEASGLIESLILQTPLSAITLHQTYTNGKTSTTMVDGAWRWTVIQDFINNKFVLEDMAYWPDMEGRTYGELPPQMQRRIQMAEIPVMTLEPHMTQDMVDRYVKQLGHRH